MEKASNVAMVTLDCRWNDLGAWSSVWEEYPKDGQEKCFDGQCILHWTLKGLWFAQPLVWCRLWVSEMLRS